MHGRGGQYGFNGYGHQNNSQYYGYQNYQQYGYGPSSSHGYQQQQYGYSQQGYPHNGSHSSHYQSGPPRGQYPPRGRGAPHPRGRGGQFNNISWRPDRAAREQPEEVTSGPATSAGSPDDDDNPFRPPANLRAEDEEVVRARKVAEAKPEKDERSADDRTEAVPADEADDFSFSLKPQQTSVPTSKPRDVEKSPLIPKKYPSTESPFARSVFHKGRPDEDSPAHAAQEPASRVRKEKIKKKVLRPKPVLTEEHAQSESVYFRKTGNESVVGSGTYGKVYKATHVYTGKMVALKKIRMEGERDGFPVTAIREIKLLQALRHCNVVPLREVMVERNDCYMVFEYLHHDLTGLLNHPTFVLSPAHKKHLAKQLFEGLDYLHRRGVLHRDIKAANILISKSGELKLADFGLARFYQKRAKEDYTNRVITIWYRPPELLLGETQYDGAVDIWSAACVMVEIFLRHAIFPGNGSEIDQLDKIYSILGTPSRSEWPGVADLQWYELLRPSQRIQSTFAEKYKSRISPEAFELLQAMFLYDPANRPTAADVLNHAYFVSEEPAPAQAVELENLQGDWHEFESKQLRKEKEKQERRRREKERESEKRKREESIGGDTKKPKLADDKRAM